MDKLIVMQADFKWYSNTFPNDVVEAHCYVVDIVWTDREQIHNRINNSWCSHSVVIDSAIYISAHDQFAQYLSKFLAVQRMYVYSADMCAKSCTG